MPRSAANTRRQLVSWPLYRLLMVIALVPVLVAALAMRQPALPPTPPTPVAPFDGSAAATKAAYMQSLHGARGPGGLGNMNAAGWISTELTKAGYKVDQETFAADLPDQANVPMKNVIGFHPGRLPDVIAVIAHHDGIGTGVDDNASSVGVMLELAKELRPLTLQHGLLFLSTDGGTSGGQGAAFFAEHSPLAGKVVAAIVLDSVAAPDGTPIRMVIRPDIPRGTSPTLFRTASSAITRVTTQSPVVPGLFDQLSGLAVPYALAEQGPLLARGLPAVTLTAGPPPDPKATYTAYSPSQLASVGESTANLVVQLDGASEIEPAGRPDIFLGTRTIRGWLAETALVALLAPTIACTLDMAARLRRRRIPLAPALAGLGWRLVPWAAFLIALWLLPVLPGNLASGLNLAPQPDDLGIRWSGILLAALAGVAAWRFITRPRVLQSGPVGGADRSGGLAAALLGLAFAGLLLVAFNPFTLILVLPAAHAWLLLPSTARYGRRFMLLVFAVGLLGPVLLMLEYAIRFHLGLSTPRALLAMTASGYLSPAIAACLTLVTASAVQIVAIIAGRYGPAHPPHRLYN